MVCTSLGSLLRPLFYFLCSILLIHRVEDLAEQSCKLIGRSQIYSNKTRVHKEMENTVDRRQNPNIKWLMWEIRQYIDLNKEITCHKGLEDFSIVPAEQLSFDTVTFPFLFLVGGIFCGAAFVLCELVAIRFQRPKGDKLPRFQ